VKKGDEMKAGQGGNVTPPPPPPPPPTGNKVQKESAGPGEKELFTVVEEMPEYPGGVEVLQHYIQEMCQKTAQTKNLKGSAIVNFTVDSEGNVTDVKAVNQDNDEVAKAAVGIVSGLQQWKPGKQRGKAVPVKYALKLNF
jgi:hypothetical protein